ncbi:MULTISPECIES: squalene--hopene cyclase [Methylomonas]|uniref:Squalene--hopene cyclase n=2 Tax=Methylomonas TaxID=416 RepID=A0A126T929_9GAMM|nr:MULTISPECIES: squalene--hopene cyclase [Methylomonas]AMK78570.1 squalene--hopene cyclase [Methylomonas denitrificans]OAH98896.1 squalene-hopene cyclase [Methylomonas methanica]TCV77405.1 squalene-hopene/tetraprenyl-beta-curcumene cyclase [Methylomonas methanica]
MLIENSSLSGADVSHATAPVGAKPKQTNPDSGIALAKAGLLGLQNPAGYWVFELEADCTIPAEYILMMHYMAEIDTALQAKIANFLRSQAGEDGSYPLYKGGPGDLSCTIKAYYALKMAGDGMDAAHMQKAREWILTQGGAAKANVFTRIMLAMFQQIPWRGVPFIPVEIMLLPKWFPFHIDKVSYWSRTVMVPLSILCTYQVKARNPRNIDIAELFLTPADQEKHYFSHVKTPLGKAILVLDRLGRRLEPLLSGFIRHKATAKATDWFMARLNGYDGLGAIFTAMVNAYEAMDYLGVPADNEQRQIARAAIDKLLVVRDDTAYCQPCVSPIWDTGLAVLALQEADSHERDPQSLKATQSALRWLANKQLSDEPGDWRVQRPNLAGGGWAFQFGNSYYPDVDDTAVVAYAMLQADTPAFAENIRRAANWIAGMQSRNGGYGAFDADNDHYYLNQIPFADHGALLDPPTADVSARCIMLLGKLGAKQLEYRDVIDRCIAYLRAEQEADGSWFGRWGTNYIYGTWSVLLGFEAAGVAADDASVCRAVTWLKSRQRADGGWGEGNIGYHDPRIRGEFECSTAFHTALAVMALLAAKETDCPEVSDGVKYLLETQQADGFWHDDCFNAPGFPKFFYLKYHGYDKFFPLWALARYRNARKLQ